MSTGNVTVTTPAVLDETVPATPAKTRATRGTAKSDAPKIYAAIAAIQAGVGTIPKNGEMKVKGVVQYTFVKNDDILSAISKLLIENAVVVSPQVVEHTIDSADKGGRTYSVVKVTLKQTYIHAEDGSSMDVIAVGEAGGFDDKGTRKAITQAQKIANLLTFSIASGEEDPDSVDNYRGAPEPGAASRSNKPAGITKSKPSTVGQWRDYIKETYVDSGVTDFDAVYVVGKEATGQEQGVWMGDAALLEKVAIALKAKFGSTLTTGEVA